MHRALVASLFVGVLILSACSEPNPTPTMGNRRAHTAHLNISFPADQASKVQEFLVFAEDVYADVNGLLNGALPPTIGVTLVSEHGNRLSESGIVISLQSFECAEQTMARELVYVALGELVGHRRDRPYYGFFYEGLGAWVEEHYERKLGSADPRPLWAAYGYAQGWAELGKLKQWEKLMWEIEDDIAYAIGWSFVSHFISVYGQHRLPELLDEMSRNSSVCAALDSGGFDCEGFVQSWQDLLGTAAASHDFTSVPQITADLGVTREGQLRNISVVVRITNLEGGPYRHCVAYTFGENWTENCHTASRRDLTADVPLGQVPAGTRMMWDATVWSNTVQSWIRTGWHEEIIP